MMAVEPRIITKGGKEKWRKGEREKRRTGERDMG